MKLKLEINLDNAAFEDGGVNEVKRAVKEALDQIDDLKYSHGAVVRDINCNKVGRIEIWD